MLALLFVPTAVFAVADDAPTWLSQLHRLQVPPYDKNVTAVVLQNDCVVTVGSDGKTTTTRTYAVRLLTREGRKEAVVVQPYLVSSGKVREIKGWIIRPDGTVKSYGKDEVLDQIADPDDIYNEYRLKIIDASGEADAGTIFGYQVTSEEAPLFRPGSMVVSGRPADAALALHAESAERLEGRQHHF
jgi:hypothetical protein